jgi:hypothetical protein
MLRLLRLALVAGLIFVSGPAARTPLTKKEYIAIEAFQKEVLRALDHSCFDRSQEIRDAFEDAGYVFG